MYPTWKLLAVSNHKVSVFKTENERTHSVFETEEVVLYAKTDYRKRVRYSRGKISMVSANSEFNYNIAHNKL